MKRTKWDPKLLSIYSINHIQTPTCSRSNLHKDTQAKQDINLPALNKHILNSHKRRSYKDELKYAIISQKALKHIHPHDLRCQESVATVAETGSAGIVI